VVLLGDSWLEFKQGVDAQDIYVGAYIFLPAIEETSMPKSSPSMQTIAATKISGCQRVTADADGWAFFVHEWGTRNRQLRLSWTDHTSACHELTSKNALVPLNTWVNVGFSLSKDARRAVLLIQSQVIADTSKGLGTFTTAGKELPMSSAESSLHARYIGMEYGTLHIGAHMPQQRDAKGELSHLFVGFISRFWVMRMAYGSATSNSEELVQGPVPSLASVTTLDLNLPKAFDGNGARSILEGLRIRERHVPGVIADPPINYVAWSQKPSHPLAPVPAPEPALPAPRLDLEALRKTWPRAWTAKHSEETLFKSQNEAYAWADAVRDATRHSWNGYKQRAWGRDEIKPVSGGGKDWCRMAITMLDSLSTLWVQNLTDEFEEARHWLESNPQPGPGKHGHHSLFEINIRALGGLLSAHSLSGHKVFLETARRLADKMVMAFDSPNGIPKSQVDIGSGESSWHKWNKNVLLAEATTVQVEFRYLSRSLGIHAYQQAADRAMNAVLEVSEGRGLVPLFLTRGIPTKWVGTHYSFGAMGDSYYEYLLKQWLQSGKREDRFKKLWKTAVEEMMSQLVLKTRSGLTFIAEKDNNKIKYKMDHLSCFVPGMLMLGSQTLPVDEVNPMWEKIAVEVTRTCYEMYRRSPTGLSPEFVVFKMEDPSKDMEIGKEAPYNILRPETLESIFYMHYYTGDPIYRQWAHEIFEAFNRHAKVRWGYSGIADVRKLPVKHKDTQESFWISETLKYLYLIFAPANTLNLSEFVLSTEAHPLRMWS